MNDELLGEVLSDYGDVLAQLINALAKAGKEHDRFISVTLTITDNMKQESDEEPDSE